MKKAEKAVLIAENCMQLDNSEEAHIELQRVKTELKRVLAIEEQFWRQKSRIK